MHKGLKELYKEINGGKIRGVRKVIASALGIDETAVSKWSSGETKPSEENIEKMAKIFNKHEDRLTKIFAENARSLNYKNQTELDFYKKELAMKDEMIELLKDKIECQKRNFEETIKKLEEKISGKKKF